MSKPAYALFKKLPTVDGSTFSYLTGFESIKQAREYAKRNLAKGIWCQLRDSKTDKIVKEWSVT